jgi:hypothetical protein
MIFPVLQSLALLLFQLNASKGSFFDDYLKPPVDIPLTSIYNDGSNSLDDQHLKSLFEWEYANTSAWLSAASYCPFATLLSRTYEGYSEGFIPTDAISNARYDVQVRSTTSFLFSYGNYERYLLTLGIRRAHAESRENLYCVSRIIHIS